MFDDDLDFGQFLINADRQLHNGERVVTVDMEEPHQKRVVRISKPNKKPPAITRSHRLLNLPGAKLRDRPMQTVATRREIHIVKPSAAIAKTNRRGPAATASTLGSIVAGNDHGRGTQRAGVRLGSKSNPHSSGYSCRLGEGGDMPLLEEHAILSDGQPSIRRCIWRGMFRVRGHLGEAAAGRLESSVLRNTLHHYTREGRTSTYATINRTLGWGAGKDLPEEGEAAKLRELIVELVMTIRLLWSDDARSPAKVYRGIHAPSLAQAEAMIGVYEEARALGVPVQWDSFISSSRSREVALGFAAAGGAGAKRILFTILRETSHAAAADIPELSAFPDEQEVLMLPGLRFDVKDIHHRTDLRHEDGLVEIVLKELHTYPHELP